MVEVCLALEAVLTHRVKAKVTTGASWFLPKSQEETPNIWPFLKKFLSKQELDRFYLLSNITSDLGRQRSWLSSCLNEHTLERHLRKMTNETETVLSFYHPDAFMADPERASVLPAVAAGLNSILFAINIDRKELNEVSKSSAKVEDIVAEDVRKLGGEEKRKSKGRVVSSAAQIVTLDGDEVRTESVRSRSRRNLEKKMLISQTEGKTRRAFSEHR